MTEAATLLWGALIAGAFAFVGALAYRANSPVDRALLHPTRSLLLKRITSWPGANIAELHEAAQISRGTAEYHIRFLEEAGLIRSCGPQSVTRFVPASLPESFGAAVALLRRGRLLELVMAVRGKPLAAQHEITDRLSISRRVFREYADLLLAEHLIEEIRDARTRRYAVTPALERVLAVMAVPDDGQDRPPRGPGADHDAGP